jgi:hypothetical protein
MALAFTVAYLTISRREGWVGWSSEHELRASSPWNLALPRFATLVRLSGISVDIQSGMMQDPGRVNTRSVCGDLQALLGQQHGARYNLPVVALYPEVTTRGCDER